MNNIAQVELTDEELQDVIGGADRSGWANASGISFGTSGYGANPFNNGAISSNYSTGTGNAGYSGGNGGLAFASGQATSFGGAATAPGGIGITASGGSGYGSAWNFGW